MPPSAKKPHAVNLRLTQAVDIVAFVDALDIPVASFDTPYTLSPAPGGERVYAMLRQALDRNRKVAIAYVLIKTRRRLAAVTPCGESLLLTTLLVSQHADDHDRQHAGPAAQATEDELIRAIMRIERTTPSWNFDDLFPRDRQDCEMPAAVTEWVSRRHDENEAIKPDARMLIADDPAVLSDDDVQLPVKSVLRQTRLAGRPKRDSWPRARIRRPLN